MSLYGATKLASEQLALEYGVDFRFPGVGEPLRSARRRRAVRPRRSGHLRLLDQQLAARAGPCSYIGFGGTGHQVRDCLHPADLVPLLERQIAVGDRERPAGRECRRRASVGAIRSRSSAPGAATGSAIIASNRRPNLRPFDVPWMVLDAATAREALGLDARANDRRDPRGDPANTRIDHPDWLDAHRRRVPRERSH